MKTQDNAGNRMQLKKPSDGSSGTSGSSTTGSGGSSSSNSNKKTSSSTNQPQPDSDADDTTGNTVSGGNNPGSGSSSAGANTAKDEDDIYEFKSTPKDSSASSSDEKESSVGDKGEKGSGGGGGGGEDSSASAGKRPFSEEKERHKLKMQHIVEKEKLVLAVEQEILRVHGRAARALANQSLPFSVCTILKDAEVYNIITPEQEEKDRNARSRYNGRLFLSWLQDVDDKWEKIKEAMLLRHHNEAESLHAVQKMDWEWKMKENLLCEFKAKPVIDDTQVPMVNVSDDFDLLPA
ncbi:conserved hypothetical protein [Culex quinquefasciatus]|uniref:Ankyrin repeat domain-containing protein 12 n=1 Tax=Culex quinquefasciatus TaxID=7176 RepID=B0XLV8_CULQU|nr:conserved hypothetical protein [Culex quinquefasciatus]|eukprot:XP_001870629.1 conserved hypothetical protein [Culex quinquefasciatus]